MSSIILISLASTALVLFGFRAQIEIWEFGVDLKVVAFAIMVTYFGTKYRLDFGKFGLNRWNPQINIAAFLSPLPLLAIVVASGILLGSSHYSGVENSLTFLLANVIDIPAVYFFSITIVLLEEIIFRGVVFDLIFQNRDNLKSIFFSALIWAVANLDGLAQIPRATVLLLVSEFLFIVAVGVVCSSLYCLSDSVWPGYSFRIGMRIYCSALLLPTGSAMDAFFTTNSPILSSNGLLLSMLSFLLAFAILNLRKNVPIHAGIR
ncbi:MAG TPA: CPBP family intramembrane glutamic endopeptidase [Candidatus Hodarchaeales archaeon]|nr:CPBP family intramembrane glutamic endopeptidase [Candidatus Hodarchaeales archaeon]